MTQSMHTESSQQDSRTPVNEQEYWYDIAEEASVAGDWETYQQAIERATGKHYESPEEENEDIPVS